MRSTHFHGLTRQCVYASCLVTTSMSKPILYNGPLPLLVPHNPPLIPHLSTLVASIIGSSDKLFFVSHLLGNQSTREWCLIFVAFVNSVSLSPSCLQDGCYLVEFYNYITATFTSIQLINVIGCNIICLATLPLRLPPPRRTLFFPPIHPQLML